MHTPTHVHTPTHPHTHTCTHLHTHTPTPPHPHTRTLCSPLPGGLATCQDGGPRVAVSPPRMGRRGDEHRLRQVFRSHPPGGRVGPSVGAGHGPGHVPCPRGHVQVAPPGLQDHRGPPPVVAGHRRHPPGVPLVGDLGECAHHDLEMGGGLPTPVGVRADSRPPLRSRRGRGGRPGAGGPAPPQGCRPRLRGAGVGGLRG